MSVIAKMNTQTARDFGCGALIEFSCVCANDLMAAYAESHEDKLFTKYSPWGEARLHVRAGVPLPESGDQFYLLILSADEIEAGAHHDQAAYSAPIYVSGVTDRGEGQAKQVEFVGGMNEASGVTGFNWRMAVDNPGATDQLVPGRSGYVVGFYPVTRFDRDEAIHAAHSPKGDTEAVAGEVETV